MSKEPGSLEALLEAMVDDVLGPIPGRIWPDPPPAPPWSDALLEGYLLDALPEPLLAELMSRPWTAKELQRLCELAEQQREWEERALGPILGATEARTAAQEGRAYYMIKIARVLSLAAAGRSRASRPN